MHCWSDRSRGGTPGESVSSTSPLPSLSREPGSSCWEVGLGREGRPLCPLPEAEAAPTPPCSHLVPHLPGRLDRSTSGELDSPGHADWALHLLGSRVHGSQLPTVGRPCEPSHPASRYPGAVPRNTCVSFLSFIFLTKDLYIIICL